MLAEQENLPGAMLTISGQMVVVCSGSYEGPSEQKLMSQSDNSLLNLLSRSSTFSLLVTSHSPNGLVAIRIVCTSKPAEVICDSPSRSNLEHAVIFSLSDDASLSKSDGSIVINDVMVRMRNGRAVMMLLLVALNACEQGTSSAVMRQMPTAEMKEKDRCIYAAQMHTHS
mmetsp:Transcript_24260/g.41259  ORF Transcript_24260/g.41259 Transcript_24260/m.41259 type:complete len:170 (-) Transcript_24260:55-564(-)